MLLTEERLREALLLRPPTVVLTAVSEVLSTRPMSMARCDEEGSASVVNNAAYGGVTNVTSVSVVKSFTACGHGDASASWTLSSARPTSVV